MHLPNSSTQTGAQLNGFKIKVTPSISYQTKCTPSLLGVVGSSYTGSS